MTVQYVTLVLDLTDARGIPVTSGQASIVPAATIPDPADSMLVGVTPVIASFSARPSPPVVRLASTDTIGPQPQGWSYRITFPGVQGGQPGFSFFLPVTGGTVQFLSALAASPAVVPGQAYIPLPQNAPVNGYVATVTQVSPLVVQWVAAGGAGAVSSVFGRTGAVVAASGDYAVGQVTGAAPSASPSFTGTPVAPTQSPLDNSTRLATTSYADAAVAVETSRATTAEALKAPLASPAFTGTPTAATAAPLTSTTQVATTAYADAAVAVEKSRAQAAENLLAPKASPTFTGTVTVPATVNPTDAAQKQYVDAAIQGLSTRASVLLASTVPLSPTNTYANGSSGVGATLTGVSNGRLSVDGTAVTNGDRILIQDEASALENGIYTVTQQGSGSQPYILTRATDFDQPAEIPGAFTFVEQGSVNGGAGFTVLGAGPYTIGVTAISWTQFSGTGQITAGSGLQKTGNTLSVVPDNTPGDIQPSPGTRAAGNSGLPADASHVHGSPAAFAPTGLTGAASASRYAGATTSGSPSTGTFSTGDFVVDQSGKIWVCTAGGTPGTWTFLVPASGATLAGWLAPKVVTLTDAATIAVNAALGNDFRVTLGGNRAMGVPSNPVDGQKIGFEIVQDGTGTRTLSWTGGAGGFAFGSGSAPILSTLAGAVDLAAFKYSSTKSAWLYLGTTGGF